MNPEDNLSVSERELYDMMSEISEDCWCAGWMGGNEYALWAALHDGELKYGQSEIDRDDLAKVAALSVQTGMWIVWLDDDELPIAEHGPYAIPLHEWSAIYESKQARATPPAPTPAAAEGQAEEEISCDQCIELAEELQREWMRKAIAETRAAAGLFDVGGFRAGMETACDEIETRMALDGDTLLAAAAWQAEVRQEVAYLLRNCLPSLARCGQKSLIREVNTFLDAAPLPRQAAVGLSDTDRMDLVAKSGVRGSTYKGITSINVIVHEDDLLCGGARYAIDCMIERSLAAPTVKASQ